MTAATHASHSGRIDARSRIVGAALLTVAERGLAGVSYRQVAQRAGVSLALVNYHFPGKAELIAATAERAFAEPFGPIAALGGGGKATGKTLRNCAARSMQGSDPHAKVAMLARAEFLLDALRSPEHLAAAKAWTGAQLGAGARLAAGFGMAEPALVARSMLDLVTGFQFFAIALGLRDETVALLWDIESPAWSTLAPGSLQPVSNGAQAGRKAVETRLRILEAAIELFVEHGPGSIGFRPIAQKAGLSTAAPAYHYQTVDALLAAAEVLLVQQSMDRYRQVMRNVDRDALTLDGLIEATTTVLIREATEHASLNLAFFSNWVEAARRPELQGAVWTFIRDIHAGWHRLFESIADEATADRVSPKAFALFLGKLIRILSTGSDLADLSLVRSEFAADFHALYDGTFWACQA